MCRKLLVVCWYSMSSARKFRLGYVQGRNVCLPAKEGRRSMFVFTPRTTNLRKKIGMHPTVQREWLRLQWVLPQQECIYARTTACVFVVAPVNVGHVESRKLCVLLVGIKNSRIIID